MLFTAIGDLSADVLCQKGVREDHDGQPGEQEEGALHGIRR